MSRQDRRGKVAREVFKVKMGRWWSNQRGCFAWMREWPGAPTHTIAGITELYEQLTPAKLYSSQKTRTSQASDTMCRLCGNAPESLPHVLADCSALAQNKYLARHNAALQVLFFEMLRDLQLAEAVPPWHSPATPKPLYESPEAQAFWDASIYAEHNHVKQNRIDERFVDHKQKRVHAVEVSCPWMTNRERKEHEKTWSNSFQAILSSNITSLLMFWGAGRER